MEQLIKKWELEKAQIAGAILEEQKRINGVLANVIEGSDDSSKLDLLEAQAELYDAMIELAKAFNNLTNK